MKLVKQPLTYLLLILVIAFSLRLYKIDNPIADWHSWRQADTAAVARNFFKYGYTPFIPKYDDMSGVAEHPIPNPNTYRFVEFPIYNSLVYFGYLINGGVDERIARLISVLFSLGSLILVYLITKKYFGIKIALVAAFLYAVLPFNVYFSRVILPEPALVFFSLGMFYFLDNWIRSNKLYFYFLGLIFTICTFLTKPVAGIYLLPLTYVYYLKEKRFWPIPKRYFAMFIPGLLPFIGWRLWMSQYPEGIPASNWLFNGNGIRFKMVFWKWILQDRFGREILGVSGTVLFFLGLIKRPKIEQGWILHLLALASFLYLIVIATGNVQHDYYQYLIVPSLVIFVSYGFVNLIEGTKEFIPRLFTIPLGILLFFLTLYLTYPEVKGLYQINNPAIVEAGKKADEILPKDAIVIAPYQGDTSFLYQTNRKGWPVVAFPVDALKNDFGANYFISTAQDAKTKWVMRKYTVLIETPNYVIVDLTKENPKFDKLKDLEPS